MSSGNAPRVLRRLGRKFWVLGFGLLLPLAVLAAGVLAGVRVWMLLEDRVLDYRAEVRLAAGPEDRAADAAGALVARVGSEEFQKAWREGAAGEPGLSEDVRLRAEVSAEGRGGVRLVCLGRPHTAVARALAKGRDLLADPGRSGIEPLRQPGHAEKKARLAGSLAEKEKVRDEAVGRERAAAEDAKDVEAAAERLKRDKAELDSLQKKLAAADEARWKAVQRELLQEKARLLPSGGELPVLDEAGKARLREEQARLALLLNEESRRDSTAKHPVVRCIAEIEARLKAAELAEGLARNGLELAKIENLRSQLSDKARAVAEAEKSAEDGRQQKLKTLAAARELRAQCELEVSVEKAMMARLDDAPAVPVKVAAVGGIADGIARGWLVWPCLAGGLAAGAILAVIVRRRALLQLFEINDKSTLAECLHLPVLGVVPMLAALPPRQEHG